MPFTIDLAACKKQMFYDVSKPQERVPDGPLPENWMGTTTRGLPVREIPHYEFPKAVYKHPRVPFREVEHRNDRFELLGTERVPTEHKSKAIHCAAHASGGPATCAECQKELETALSAGWREEPYIPAAPPKVDDDIYGPDDKEDPPSLTPAPARSMRGTKENPL